ncbi:hypothetical protein ACTXT7_002359 [Hymenolepis weldensis]
MSSYLTSSLIRAVSSIKRTVNEFVNETSGAVDIGKVVNSVNEESGTGYVDFIQTHSRRASIPDSSNFSSSTDTNDAPEPTGRLSLAEIFGDSDETFKDQTLCLSELESAEQIPIFHPKEPCSPMRTPKTPKRMHILETTVKRKPPSPPSLSTLLEEDTEKSIESCPQNVYSSESEYESSSKSHLEESKLPKIDKTDPQIELKKPKSLEDPVDAVVEEVRQCWNETSAQVKARLDELEKMMTATDELKTLERELDRWLSRAESNLADAISNTQDVNERKRMIQEIIDRLPDGETKFTIHQNKCEAILAKYSKEDTQKFRTDQEAIQMRWSQLVSGLRESLEGAAQMDPDLIEIPVSPQSKRPESDLQRIVRLRTVTSQQPGTYSSGDPIRPMESRSMETSMIDAFGNGDGNQLQTYSTMGHRGYGQKVLLDENYRNNQISRSVEIRSRPYDSRSSQRLSNENWRLFLAQLRQMNDWLAHQDANFHQLKGTIGGDSESVSQLINSFSILEEEMRQHRFQIEEILDRGKMFMQDQSIDGRYNFNMESEGDSDGSEYEPGKVDLDDSNMSTKRIIRRIRRHLNYLDKHWAELSRSMLTYRQQLDRAFQKLTVFERVLDDAENELKAAQKLLMSQDPSSLTNDQTLPMIWDACASVTHAIAGLDGQALCLSDDGTIISHVLISRLDGLKIRSIGNMGSTITLLGLNKEDIRHSRGALNLSMNRTEKINIRDKLISNLP